MKVLIVGSGGREHALAWKIRQSPHVSWLGVAPGNGGISSVGETVDISPDDIESITSYVKDNDVNLVVIGPEAPLADGIVDCFDSAGRFIFGPGAAAARIESSKSFAKDLMARADIPTAQYRVFNDSSRARSYILEEREAPLVVKASGLAAGKGVFVCETRDQAIEAVVKIMDDKVFGESGSEIVIEDFLEGPEVSLQVITDGEKYITLPPVQDHKRIGEGDTGPNTGGMGAYCPAPVLDDGLIRRCGSEIIEPVLNALKNMGTPYRGLLYVGLILTSDGPKVLEFNCRFGDPETQAVLPLLSVDLVDLMLLSTSGKLGAMMQNLDLESHDWKRISHDGYAATVILASSGYPGSYETGKEITGLPSEREDLVVFHAGTRWDQSRLLTSGGRVLSVTGLGDSLKDALEKAYMASDDIHFEGKYLRRDIGWRAL